MLVAALGVTVAAANVPILGATTHGTQAAEAGIHKIRRVVFITQENRSFDSFFGAYPGADRIPAKGGTVHGLQA
jgi:phospholipase C